MKQFAEVSDIRQQLNLLQSLLWINKYYKAAFTKHRVSPIIEQYWWFTYDLDTGIKTPYKYSIAFDSIVVQFGTSDYQIVEISTNRVSVYTQALLQMVNICDGTDYRNFLGEPIPAK